MATSTKTSIQTMEYRNLGQTHLRVSSLCLGSMTWGEQNTKTEGFRQLDQANAHGVNFIDTAEMYPIPPKSTTYAKTETIIREWLQQRGRRDDLIIATKVTGPAPWATYMREEGYPRLTRPNILKAVDGSLQRLKTDYIDLYQLHWPDRNTNFFGKRSYEPQEAELPPPIEETLEALNELVKAGKVRHIGLSNETAWGAMRYQQLAGENNWPRPVSIQNPYNLLNRTFEVGLAEVAHREQMGLLAYSPLGFGVLSGKYLQGARPEGARITLFPARYQRYLTPEAVTATEAYVALAQNAGLDPAQMALAYVRSQQFVTSVIIGATTEEQLRSNLESADLALSQDILDGIEHIQKRIPNPVP